MKIAVIKTGGKQYLIKPGTKVKLEKLSGTEGETINFPDVLLLTDDQGSQLSVGAPLVKAAQITGKILKQGRARKIRVVKYKSKTRYKKVHGHRQHFTEVEFNKI